MQVLDFEEIAKRAKEKADAQEAAEAKAFADSRGQVSAGQAVLDKALLPILARAKEAIQKTGVPCFIEPKFSVGDKPHVAFRCAGSPQNDLSGRKSEPQSVAAYFESVDGTTISVRIGKYPNAPGETEPLGWAGVQDAEELVEKAVEAVLASYYEQVANLRRAERLT